MLTTLYEDALPDERIRDTSVPPRQRLLECVWRMLEPFSTGQGTREVWTSLFETFLAPGVTDETRAGYRILTRQAEQRVESWLVILETEGVLAKGDNAKRIHFILTVVDGLSIGRAFPDDGSRLEAETATLALAIDTVFAATPA